MFEAIAILGMIWISISAVYMIKNRIATGKEEDYVWIGNGNHPFKKI